MKKFFGKINIAFIFCCLLFFITNKSFAVTFISTSQKEIIRDTKRLNDLTVFRKAIEEYKTKNGFYPKLETGTNIKGYVNSSWSNQWISFCNILGLSSCPVDPINTIIGCDCSVFNPDGQCSGDNINENIDTTTCYNSKEQKFSCPSGSRIYQYQSLNNGRNYSLMMDFEYRKDNDNSAGADYWSVNSNDNNNNISVGNNCRGIILSNSKPKCGDNIVQFGEECDGKGRVEFCTNEIGELGKMPIKCIDCKYEVKNTKLTTACNNEAFCGDGIIQVEKGEECDGGYEKMCFSSLNQSLGKHDWYNEQIRYCQNNCKWNKTDNYKNSLTHNVCGGYCGDGKVQSGEDCDFGVEYIFWDNNTKSFKSCENYNSQDSCPSNCLWSDNNCLTKKNINSSSEEKHCFIRSGSSCKYINNSPLMPFIKNSNFTALSYVKGGEENYSESISLINENNLSVNSISRNSVYLEFSLDDIVVGADNISDIDGDEIMYKIEFIEKANSNIGFYKSNNIIGNKTIFSSNRGSEITGKWLKHSDLAKIDPNTRKFTTKIYFRIYSTVLSEKLEDANQGIIHLLDGSYFGDYKFRISVKDSWNMGVNVEGNRQGVVSSKDIRFYIGTSCGDHVLQAINDEGQHEYCEIKSGYNKFSNWSVNEPSGNGNCATIKFGNGWDGKWDDVPCDDLYYGICEKKQSMKCPEGWIEKEMSSDFLCYKLTNSKTTYDLANTECYYEHGEAQLVNIENPAKNEYIENVFGNKNEKFFWIGYYSVQKLRTKEQNKVFYVNGDINGILSSEVNKYSLWVPSKENGNPDVYSDSMYNGGTGKSFSSQYLCSSNCNDIGGFCGNGVLENGTQSASNESFYVANTNSDKSVVKNYYIGNFEQCDPTAQQKSSDYTGQTGVGSGWYLQPDGTKIGDSYGCVACTLTGGYCGNGSIDSNNFKNGNWISGPTNEDGKNGNGADFEHCDPRYVLSPLESGKETSRGGKPNYICANIIDKVQSLGFSNVYKIPNPKSEGRISWFPKNNENKSLTLGAFIANPYLAKNFEDNPAGSCQKSTGGYCGDGKIQMSYIGYDMSQKKDESSSNSNYYYEIYDNNKFLFNDEDIKNKKLGGNIRKIIVGTSDYIKEIDNYGKNNKGSFIGENINYFNNKSINDYWLERCDPSYFPSPIETNNLRSGIFYKKVDNDLNYIAEQNFQGYPTLRYECKNDCDFITFDINKTDKNGLGEPISKEPSSNRDYTIGYCGDGVVTGYGSSGSVLKVNNGIRESCDPKNHIVGPNGSDSTFGDNAIHGCKKNTELNYLNSTFVFGKDCSSYITPETSSNNRTYACSFDCNSVLNNNGGGYCGDGITQYNFFEECDPKGDIYKDSDIGLINNFSVADINSNYICGVQAGYENHSFDIEYQNNKDLVSNFEATSFRDDVISKKGKVASCKTFGGYCGDGLVQSCSVENNFFGGLKNYNSCYISNKSSSDCYSYVDENNVKQDYCPLTLIAHPDANSIETCDSIESACFVVENGIAKEPVLFGDGKYELYDFKTGSIEYPISYLESSVFTVNGAGKANSSSVKPGNTISIDGVCGSGNNSTSVSSTDKIQGFCSKGQFTNPKFNNSSKKFEWNCKGFGAGTSVLCTAETNFSPEIINGECGGSNDFICNEPICTIDSKHVYQGDICDEGKDCVKICFGKDCKDKNNKNVGTGDECDSGANCGSMKICSVECSYGGDDVNVGEPCTEGRTCKDKKQSFVLTKEIEDKCNTGFAGDVIYDNNKWTWTCFGLNGGSDEICNADVGLPIDGKCNNTNLGTCEIGLPTSPRFNKSKNKWEWKCNGFNSGEYDECKKDGFGNEEKDADCGSNNDQNFPSLYALNNLNGIYNPIRLCSRGLPSKISLVNGTKYSWNCSNVDEHGNTQSKLCSANVLNDPIDGKCNIFNNSIDTIPPNPCESGYPTNVIYDPIFNKLKWTCKGIGLRTDQNGPVKDARCVASVRNIPANGKCGDPFVMFKASSGLAYPMSSAESKKAQEKGKRFSGMDFEMCKVGYPEIIENVDTIGEILMGNPIVEKFNKTPGNVCYSETSETNKSSITPDCVTLTLKLPIVGITTIFKMAMPWQWVCKGVGDGAVSSSYNYVTGKEDDALLACRSFNPSFLSKKDGECGADARQVWASADLIQDRCNIGYATKLRIEGNRIKWECKGFNGGTPATCWADYKKIPKVKGSCGSSNGQSKQLYSYKDIIDGACDNGVFKNLKIEIDSSEKIIYSWSCKGINGGTTANCFSEIIDVNNKRMDNLDGECNYNGINSPSSTSHIYENGGCKSGIIKSIRYDDKKGTFKWSCAGSENGFVDECEITAGDM